MEVEIKDVQISCLSGIIDLQRVCQKEHVKFSNETNQYLLYQTLKKVGPAVAQKLVTKLVERGDIKWDDEEDFEVEKILEYSDEDGEQLYLIKWKGWSSQYNTWEPKENLSCTDLLEEFHSERSTRKRRLTDIDTDPVTKKRKLDEIFSKLVRSPVSNLISPMHLLSASSPKKGEAFSFKGLLSAKGITSPKFNPAPDYSNPRTKVYRQKKQEIQKALKDWEKQLNKINTDPAPIEVENIVDLEGPPDNFEYINDYREGEGIEIPQDPLIGCECDDCISNKKKCCPTSCGSQFAYYKNRRLRVVKGTPIYECNKRCKCGPECPNRVVQHGRKFKVCVFRTKNGRGWGVKTLQKIKEGSFVMEYVGEVITNEEAERRGKTYDAVGRTYLFDLDYNDGDCPFTVDAGFYGNVSHFVNHSCDPNLEVYGVWINTLDPRLPRITLFAKRDIEKGEELTFDYMMTGDTTHNLVNSSILEEHPNEVDQDGTVLKKTDVEASNENINNVNSDTNVKTDNSVNVGKDSSENSVKDGDSLVIKEFHPVKDDEIGDGNNSSGKETTKTVNADSSVSTNQIDSEVDNVVTESVASVDIIKEEDSVIQKAVNSESLDSTTENSSLAEKTIEKDSSVPVSDSNREVAEDSNSKIAIDTDTTQIEQKESPKKPPKSLTDQYRIVCQCGAKNCRKYLF